MSRRILDETTKSTFASDDYLYMDSATDGATKITPDNLVRNTAVAQQLAQHIADAEDDVEQITTDIEDTQSDLNDVKSDIGDLEDLETTDKSSIVNAINEARGTGGSGSGLTADIKTALLQIASKVAYIDEHGQDYYDQLYDSFYPSITSISAVYTQSGTVYSTTDLNSLKSDLVVTAHYGDGTNVRLANTDYTLSGTLTTGTSTITVAYGNKTTTFNVTVTGVVSIDAVYTQSGVITDSNTLSDLIPDLVVTATLSDSTSFVVPSTDYTLSGTLSDSTSTITVTYGSLTDTFTVTVTEVIDYTINPLEGVNWLDGYTYNQSTGVLTATSGEHCTEKFTTQSCIYILNNSDTTNNRYFAIFAWDNNGNYLGYCQFNAQVFSLKKGYTYAIKVYNTATFDASTLSFMPKDNSSTATSEFSIKMSDYIGNITGSSGRFEFNVQSVMSAAGVTASNINTKINNCNHLAVLTPTSTTESFTNRDFTFWFYNINTFMFKLQGISTVADAEAWITANNPEIIFNY